MRSNRCKKEIDTNFITRNSVNNQSGYKDLQKYEAVAINTQSITFTATFSTIYWQWLLADIVDGKNHVQNGSRYNYIKLSKVILKQNLTNTNKCAII